MSEAAPRGLRPGSALAGPLAVPRSKSIAQRMIVAAALADGPTRIGGVPAGEDVRHTTGSIQALGVPVGRLGVGGMTVDGRPPGVGGWGAGALECRVRVGESGTGARLLTATAALCGDPGTTFRIEPAGSLARRGSPALFAALARAGVTLEPLGERPDGWPVRFRPVGPPSDLVLEDPGSSQEVSGLLLALAAWPDTIRLEVRGAIPSRPYVDLTLHALRGFGVEVGVEERVGALVFHVPGPLEPPPEPLRVEADASAAAVGLVAGCLSGGGVQVRGLTLASPQGDVRVVEHLRAFGIEAGEERGALFATGDPTRGVDLDLAGEPDLAPPLAALAAAAALAGHASTLRGLGTLPGKESPRIRVLAEGLRAIGVDADAGEDFLRVAPGRRPAPGEVVLDAHGDHRMAFAFALLGLLREDVWVRGPGCVAKSWPSFWEDLAAAGAATATGRSPG